MPFASVTRCVDDVVVLGGGCGCDWAAGGGGEAGGELAAGGGDTAPEGFVDD
jgi:hypothetical protein